MVQDNVDDLGRKLFGTTLQEASIRVVGFMVVVALVLGTLAWMIR
ncbi:hypothetical protein [Arenibaculum pallidiluteum]|nr:hypothetical protein [Arenibaculum pallidiluteum]